MQIRYELLRYQIDQSFGCFAGPPRMVSGFACQLPGRWHRFRICVRHENGRWCADHYDSGYALLRDAPSVDDSSMEALVAVIIARLNRRNRRAKLAERLRETGYGWIVEEAGLHA